VFVGGRCYLASSPSGRLNVATCSVTLYLLYWGQPGLALYDSATPGTLVSLTNHHDLIIVVYTYNTRVGYILSD
jgi:hypothetical protein